MTFSTPSAAVARPTTRFKRATVTVLAAAGLAGAALTGPLASNVAKALSIVLASAFRFLVYRT
ncbi:hypothetical protein ABZT51_51755, partial [Streptomyces sp. NPDC005373]